MSWLKKFSKGSTTETSPDVSTEKTEEIVETSVVQSGPLEKAWSSIDSVDLILKNLYRIGLANEWFSTVFKSQSLASSMSAMPSPNMSFDASVIPHVATDAAVGLQIGERHMAYYPPVQGPFARAIKDAQFKVVMRLDCDVVVAILEQLDSLEHEVFEVPLDSSTRVQVIDCLANLSRVRKAQYAAFVLKERCLVIWSESTATIIEHAEALENKMIDLVWNSNPHTKDTAIVTAVALPEDLEEQASAERPKQYLGTFITSFAIVLLILFAGLGCRQLLIETLADGSWLRWALTLTLPFTLVLTSFFTMVVAGSIIKIFGPIKQLSTNSSTFSAKPPPRMRGTLPHLTIQCPVYKESIVGVIEPTMASIRAAISTYELQGGTASIFVNDDGMQLLSDADAKIRQAYYASNNIGWVARPAHGKDGFIRAGKFKKASNMNFALRIAYQVEQGLTDLVRHGDWTDEEENQAYDRVLAEVLGRNPLAWAAGDIRMGDLILLIDSDTRVPKDCLLDAASEFEESPHLAILQHVSGVMMVVNNFWEEAIAQFTKVVYDAIEYGCAAGEGAPFVGHNAFLRWTALQEIAEDDANGAKIWWSESHVSEDFEMSLKLQVKGYSLRLAAYSGREFKEGVSLTVYDELARWQKYAFGCSELVFHPCKSWFTKGPFTPLFKKMWFANIPGVRKFTICAYVFSYYAIASAWILSILNFFLVGWFASDLSKFYVSGWTNTLANLVVFAIAAPIIQAIVAHRAKQGNFLTQLATNYGWTIMLSIFLGGLSIHVSMALLCHMFSINMSWSATAKELDNSNFWLEVPKIARNFKFLYIGLIIGIVGMIVLSTPLMPHGWAIKGFLSGLPLGLIIGSHFAVPLIMNPQLMAFSF